MTVLLSSLDVAALGSELSHPERHLPGPSVLGGSQTALLSGKTSPLPSRPGCHSASGHGPAWVSLRGGPHSHPTGGPASLRPPRALSTFPCPQTGVGDALASRHRRPSPCTQRATLSLVPLSAPFRSPKGSLVGFNYQRAGGSLAVPWLGQGAFLVMTQVQSLVRELRPQKLRSLAKIKTRQAWGPPRVQSPRLIH